MKKWIWFPASLGLLCVLFLFSSCQSRCLHSSTRSEIIPPSCDSEGYTLHYCSDCFHQYRTDYVPPTGHKLTVASVAPTCIAQGYTRYACACGYNYKGSFLPPLGHVYTSTITAPTCEKEGYVTQSCTVCQYSYCSEILSATGHEYMSTIVSPTCDGQGYTEHVCVRGDSTYISDLTAPIGHTLTVTEAIHPTLLEAGQLTQRCHSCDSEFVTALRYADVYANAYVENGTPLAKGIDISYHNHTSSATHISGYAPLQWSVIKDAGFEFAILRAGYRNFKDPTFEMNYADAKAAGFDLGVYYYAYAKTAEEAKAEAEELIRWLSGKQFEYPIYYDMEAPELMTLGKDLLTEICMTFIDTLRGAGYYGALYSNQNWLTYYLHEDTLKGFSELWYARYQKDPAPSSESFPTFAVSPDSNDFFWLEKYGKMVGMWQYTQRGEIENSGIRERVDFNFAYKDYPRLMKTFCLNGYGPNA